MKKMTKEKFINKANLVHNNKYDYSLINNFNGVIFKVPIICPKHGKFEQIAHDHLKGFGCKKCKVDYKNAMTKVCIICPKHGEFWQTPNKHLLGHGCLFCAKENNKERIQKINEQKNYKNILYFLEKCKKVHNNRYEYLSKYKDSSTKIKIRCKKCNYTFYQIPHSHLNGSGCPKCNKSKGEIEIENILTNRNIKFIPQYKFSDCRGKKRPLLFDFYLPDYNICIEYDGEQHFKPVLFKGLSFDKAVKMLNIIKMNDRIKDEFCYKNNIKLIRISFNDEIENKILESLMKE